MQRPVPSIGPENSVLRTSRELSLHIDEITRLRLPLCVDRPKNWDALGAVRQIVSHFTTQCSILDAGSEVYSCVLPWLAYYGFTSLVGINLSFPTSLNRRRGPILYEYGDITDMHFGDRLFDAVVCQSVIEHGVDIEQFLRESHRVLRPGGRLIVSTDYWDTPIDTRGKTAFGQPVKIFCRDDMRDLITLASDFGLRLTSSPSMEIEERVVTWKEHGLQYTFMTLSFVRSDPVRIFTPT